MSIILLGDSVAKRLLVRYPTCFDLVSFDFCVSGIKIQGLWALVKDKWESLRGREVIVLIGTNNFLQREELCLVKNYYRSLIRYLRRVASVVSLVEVLPIPRLEHLASVKQDLLSFNGYIRSFAPAGLVVHHTYNRFCEGISANRKYYVKKFNNGRVDLVHPNKLGLELLYSVIFSTDNNNS